MWVCRFSVLRKERKLYWNAVVIVTRVWRVWTLARGKSIVHSSGNSLGTEIYHQIFVFINGRNQCEDFCRYWGEAMDFQWHKTEIFDNASVWTGPEPGEIKISHSQDLVFKILLTMPCFYSCSGTVMETRITRMINARQCSCSLLTVYGKSPDR